MITSHEIRQEMLLRAPRQVVWDALVTPQGWTGWFSEGVSGEFQVGETLALDFGKWGKGFAKIVEREELASFAYRWHPGGDGDAVERPDEEMTTVRFTIEDHAEGTFLVLVETGFDRLPDERRHKAIDENTGGWRHELAELQTFVETGNRQSRSSEEIICERSYPVSRERLWSLVATPAGLSSWFVESVDGDMEVGSMPTLNFKKGVSGQIKVDERVEPDTLVFRWHPGQVDGCTWDKFPESETTTVKFVLTEIEGGAHLLVVESGFENIPDCRRSSVFELNSGGWTMVMDMIGDTLTGPA